MERVTPKQRAAEIKLYTHWSSAHGDVRTWDDVRADIAKAIRSAVRDALRKARVKRCTRPGCAGRPA